MTQSIAFILCSSEAQANEYANLLTHPLYVFLNNICRWGNFNSVRILQRFPLPKCNYDDIYQYFGLDEHEITHIEWALQS